jgi:2-polyprenyl-6-methoxyphenol hydroxylase-like FAD-dependent oxidoreductase
MAIEDAVVLATSLANIADPTTALRNYEDQRRDRTRTVVALSRALSESEQLEDPKRQARDKELRRTPLHVLKEQQRDILTFPRSRW